MRCGFYETEITPPIGTTIFGYYGKRVSKVVITKLYAKAAVLECGGKYLAMLCVDALGLPRGLADFVRERVNEKTGIDKNAILIAATHSHSSGPTRGDLGVFKDRAPVQENEPEFLDAELDSFYVKMVQLLSADAVIHAYQRLEEALISFAIGEVNDVSYVREYVLDNGEIRTNPNEYKDRIVRPVSEPDKSLPIFFVKNKEGKPLGMITSFALHHDTVQLGAHISADYSGLVADSMKEKYGKNFTTVFYSGFCGNINHQNYMGEPFRRTTDEIAKIITEGVLKTIDKLEPLKEDKLDFKLESVKINKREVPKEHIERVLKLKKNPPPMTTITIADPYGDIMDYARANTYISLYVENTSAQLDVPVQVIRIGECLIYALCGEIFSQFGDIIRKQSPSDKLMLVEKANSEKFDGYVPTREMYLPNVYESIYTSAYLCPDGGYQMCDKAIELAEKIYK